MKSKKFVLAGLFLLAAITMVLLPLAGCKTEVDPVDPPARYTVKFYRGDNSEYAAELPSDITVDSGTKLTAEQLESLDGTASHIFEGWYDKDDTTQKEVAAGYTVTKDVTLVAKWKSRDKVEIELTVSGNTVELASVPAGATIHYTTDETDPKTSETSQTGTSVSITQETTIKAYAEKVGELKESDVAEKTYYVVTFDANSGAFADGKGSKTETVESGKVAKKPGDPTKEKSVFGGWCSDKGLATAYDFEAGVTQDITLYAKWTPVYTVTFEKNAEDATGEMAPQDFTDGVAQKLTANGFSRPGYGFAGWGESAEGEVRYSDGQEITVPANTPLYAKWRANPGTVVSDGLTINGVKLASTSEVQVLSETVTFASLYNADSGSNVFVENRVDSIQPFVMGQYEVTQQLYLAVMGERGGTEEPSETYGAGDEYPAYYVSWYDAVVFCNRLSQLTGLEPAYSKGDETDTSTWGDVPISSNDDWNAITCNWDASGYRLPTEAEWELAARGGNPGAEAWKYTYAGSNDIGGVAWYADNSDSKTHQVGGKDANSLNLHDMSGNVWEWCWDWYGTIATNTPPSGGASGDGRVSRGGSWLSSPGYCAVSRRFNDYPYLRYHYLGFRVVRPSSK